VVYNWYFSWLSFFIVEKNFLELKNRQLDWTENIIEFRSVCPVSRLKILILDKKLDRNWTEIRA